MILLYLITFDLFGLFGFYLVILLCNIKALYQQILIYFVAIGPLMYIIVGIDDMFTPEKNDRACDLVATIAGIVLAFVFPARDNSIKWEFSIKNKECIGKFKIVIGIILCILTATMFVLVYAMDTPLFNKLGWIK